MILMYDVKALYIDGIQDDKYPFSVVLTDKTIVASYMKHWNGEHFIIETTEGKNLESDKITDRTFFRVDGNLFRYNAHTEEFDVAIQGQETKTAYSNS